MKSLFFYLKKSFPFVSLFLFLGYNFSACHTADRTTSELFLPNDGEFALHHLPRSNKSSLNIVSNECAPHNSDGDTIYVSSFTWNGTCFGDLTDSFCAALICFDSGCQDTQIVRGGLLQAGGSTPQCIGEPYYVVTNQNRKPYSFHLLFCDDAQNSTRWWTSGDTVAVCSN